MPDADRMAAVETPPKKPRLFVFTLPPLLIVKRKKRRRTFAGGKKKAAGFARRPFPFLLL
jgi:hypothetical protein